MADFVRIASVEDVPPGALFAVDVGEVSVCLAHADDRIYAFRNNCSHRDFQLDTGEFDDHRVTCSWHGAKFDIRTGKALSLPAIKPITTYEVRVEDGGIYVSI